VADSFRQTFFIHYYYSVSKRWQMAKTLPNPNILDWIERIRRILIYGAPAIGAAVVVGQMLQVYGSCTKVY
jgi:hypothetical protein